MCSVCISQKQDKKLNLSTPKNIQRFRKMGKKIIKIIIIVFRQASF